MGSIAQPRGTLDCSRKPRILPPVANASPPPGSLESFLQMNDFFNDPNSLGIEQTSMTPPKRRVNPLDPIGEAFLAKAMRKGERATAAFASTSAQPCRRRWTHDGNTQSMLDVALGAHTKGSKITDDEPAHEDNSTAGKAHPLTSATTDEGPRRRRASTGSLEVALRRGDAAPIVPPPPVAPTRPLERPHPPDTKPPRAHMSREGTLRERSVLQQATAGNETRVTKLTWPMPMPEEVGKGPKTLVTAGGDGGATGASSARRKLQLVGNLANLLDQSIGGKRESEEQQGPQPTEQRVTHDRRPSVLAASTAKLKATGQHAVPAQQPEGAAPAGAASAGAAPAGAAADGATPRGFRIVAGLSSSSDAKASGPGPGAALSRLKSLGKATVGMQALSGSEEEKKRWRAGHQEREVIQLYELYKEKPGAKGFKQVLRACYPQLTNADLEERLGWVAKHEAELSALRQLSADQKKAVHSLFARLDADGSGSIELNEVQVAGWGAKGTPEGALLVAMFKKTDLNEDRALDVDEFTQFVEECATLIGFEQILERAQRSAMAGGVERPKFNPDSRPSLSDISGHRRGFGCARLGDD